MLEAMKSLRDEFKTMQKASEVGVDQTATSDPKPGTSKQDDLPSNPNTQHPSIRSSKQLDEQMDMDVHGPSLPPRLRESVQSEQGSDPSSDHISDQSEQPDRTYSV